MAALLCGCVFCDRLIDRFERSLNMLFLGQTTSSASLLAMSIFAFLSVRLRGHCVVFFFLFSPGRMRPPMNPIDCDMFVFHRIPR